MSTARFDPRSGQPFCQGRRRLLQLGGLGLLGLGMEPLVAGRRLAARAAERPLGSSFGRARQCILLFMWGGPAHQDTWDLKPEAPAEIRGEFRPISTSVSGVAISEHFPLLARRVDRLTLIRSMTHSDVNHTSSTHFLLTGQPPPPAGDLRRDWPHLGAVLARLGRGRPPLPPFVQMRPKLPGDVPRFVEQSQGQSAGWLGQQFDPLTIDADPNSDDYRVAALDAPDDVPPARLQRRQRLLSRFDDALAGRLSSPAIAASNDQYQRAFALLDTAAGKQAFRLADEPPELRERYGLNPHGQSVLQARRLVEFGVPLVTVFWPNDGIKNVSVYWDTHSRNFIDLRERLMPPADQAFSALVDDLADRGLLDETLVIWTGEFGRTPRVGQRNSDAGAGRDGRDHWPGCFTTVLAGAGMGGGRVWGSSDRFAAFPASDPVAPVDLAATVYHLLGIDPHLTLPDPAGRPQLICPGTPIAGLL